MEQRRTPRFKFTGIGTVKDLLTDSDLGTIADISTGGIKLLNYTEIGLPKSRMVTISMPNEEGKPLVVTGEIRIAWQGIDQDESCLCSGFRFVSFSLSEKQSLLQAAKYHTDMF